MGSNVYISEAQLMRRKLGMPTIAPKYNHFIEMGKHNEAPILGILTKYHRQPKTMLQSLKWPWLTCSPDAIVMRNGKAALAEIKTPAKFKEPDSVYKQYRWQVLHQMLVTGYDTCYLVYGKPHKEVDPDDPTRITVTYPDANFISITMDDFKVNKVKEYLEVSYAFWRELCSMLDIYDRCDTLVRDTEAAAALQPAISIEYL